MHSEAAGSFGLWSAIEVKPRYAIIDDLRSNVNLRNMGARPDGDGPSGKTEVPFRTRVNKYGIYGHGGF